MHVFHYSENARLCTALPWRDNERDDVSNHQPPDCLLNRLFRRRSTETSKLRVTSLCEGNSPVTGKFPAQRASNVEMLSFDDVSMIASEMHWPVQLDCTTGEAESSNPVTTVGRVSMSIRTHSRVFAFTGFT